MATTCTVALSLATAQINQPTTATITVATSTGAVTLTSITPTIGASGVSPSIFTATAISEVPLGPTTVTVPASGSLAYNVQAYGMAPGTYAIGATVVDSSGNVITATPVTFISTKPVIPSAEGGTGA